MAVVGPAPSPAWGPSPPPPPPAHICPGGHSGGLQGTDSGQPPFRALSPLWAAKQDGPLRSPCPEAALWVKNRGSGVHLRAPGSGAERRVTDNATQRLSPTFVLSGGRQRGAPLHPPPRSCVLAPRGLGDGGSVLRSYVAMDTQVSSLDCALCIPVGGDPGGKNLSVDSSRRALLRECSSLWPQQAWGF